jgi:DNA-binding IclR family transcriptional regulator
MTDDPPKDDRPKDDRPKTGKSRVLEAFAEFEGDKQFATTLARGLEILRCFTPEKALLGNKELAHRTRLPKPTVSRLTYTLSHLGYLKTDHLSSKYRLGPAVLAIGYPLVASMTLRQVARPAMKVLADYAGGSVSMGVRDRVNIVYVETSRSNSTLAYQLSDIGLSQPIAATAIGRAYLAACSPAERDAVCNQLRLSAPELWTRHEEKVAQSLAEFERYGFCMSWGDLRRDIYAVAAPLRVAGSDEIFVFNCVLPSVEVKPARVRSDIGPRLAAMVRSFSGQPTAMT